MPGSDKEDPSDPHGWTLLMFIGSVIWTIFLIEYIVMKACLQLLWSVVCWIVRKLSKKDEKGEDLSKPIDVLLIDPLF